MTRAGEKTSTRVRVSVALLAIIYLAILLAGFVAPYSPTEQSRAAVFFAPTRLHLIESDGRIHLWPFVYRLELRPGSVTDYDEDRSRAFPIRLFVRGAPYRIAGVFDSDRHLFGVEEPAKIFLFGSDQYGRDIFSRVLFGGQVSLATGMIAAGLAVGLGMLFGGLAGFYGGWADETIMRGAELFLALPWLYLLLAVRSLLPLHLGPAQPFLLLMAVIGAVGWARPARLIRGLVSSARVRDHVLAARAFGATDAYLLRKHVLPQTVGVVVTQLALLVPQYTLAEVTLSFFGLGVSEPTPSWGNMLASAQRYDVLQSYWWMLMPGIALIPVFLLYYSLANTLQRRFAHLSL